MRRDDPFDDGPRRRRAPAGTLPLRLAGHLLAHPMTTGGLLLAMATSGVIVANAIGNQATQHPAPLFRMRGDVPPSLPEETQPRAAEPPTATIAPVKVRTAAPIEVPIVRDVQMVLKDRGLYAGPIDGMLGPATSDAIRLLERQLGLPVTGEATDRLLAATVKAPRPMPLPPVKPGARAKPTPPGEPLIASVPSTPAPVTHAPVAHAPAMRVPTTRVETIAIGPATVTPPATVEPAAAAPVPAPKAGVTAPDQRLVRVQKGLAAMGYGTIEPDGRLDRETVDAIRRFELDHGLPVTGEPSDRVFLELLALDALPGA